LLAMSLKVSGPGFWSLMWKVGVLHPPTAFPPAVAVTICAGCPVTASQ
jgi:hypothetical protein